MLLTLPLSITFPLKTKKDRTVKYSLNEFMLDLSDKSWNNTRKPNHAYQLKAKKYLQDIVKNQLSTENPLSGPWPKKITLTIFRASNMHMDIIDNPVVLIKFAMDIVKISHAPDDYWAYFSESTMRDGGLDKTNPRAELLIEDIQKEANEAKDILPTTDD